jgi:hypothetical protein
MSAAVLHAPVASDPPPKAADWEPLATAKALIAEDTKLLAWACAPAAVELDPVATAPTPLASRVSLSPQSAPPSLSVPASTTPSLSRSSKQSSARASPAGARARPNAPAAAHDSKAVFKVLDVFMVFSPLQLRLQEKR